ncbi:MAG: hypothetical protein JJE09_08185 [Bacteroidia bacterium]|nr:hypothetical protein [Bacteroidia bacterium]
MKNPGIALLAIGLIMTLFIGFNLVTLRNVVDIGEIQISRDEKTPIYWSPIVGGVMAVAGLLIHVTKKKKR